MAAQFLGKSITGPFTVPSGIVTTAVPIIEYFFRHVPQVGVLTTKSIGPVPRAGNREPVLSQYAPGCFVNAVGLTNPGADRSVELFADLEVPEDRFFLVSIFGGSVEEFVQVAERLAPFADGLELNLSCPHAQGYGMAMGQDPALVEEITAAVKSVVTVPVVPKLTPNVDDIGAIARAAVAGGADAICAINTLGPGSHTAFGAPVLSNGLGGMSGKGVLPIGLKCVQEIAQAVDVPIIGCGGISSAADVEAYGHAGASIFGVGSALVGMTSEEIKHYFEVLESNLTPIEKNNDFPKANVDSGSSRAEDQIQYDLDMSFQPVTLVSNQKVTDDIAILTFAEPIEIEAGEFIFLWIPGLGEKPFSALTDDPFSLVVIDLGEFTNALMDLAAGSRAYVRGPHGLPAFLNDDTHLVAVAGGTGLAAVYQLARDHTQRHTDAGARADIFLGARSSERLYFREQCADVATLHLATDDGSEGYAGRVTEALDEYLDRLSAEERAAVLFYNCGPEPMVHAAEAVQRKYCGEQQIFSAIDYLTKCGVGICGACASPDGRRLCVDGPFLCAENA